MFFATEPSQAVLSDINSELISTWIQVRDNADELLRLIRALPIDATTYITTRSGQTARARMSIEQLGLFI